MKNLILVGTLALILGACGRNNDPVADTRESVEDPALQMKDFQGKCQLTPIDAVITGILTGGDAIVKSARTQYRFEGNMAFRKTLVYTTNDCSGEIAARFIESGEFDIKPNARTTESATHIDLNFRQLMVSAQSAAGVEAANSLILCGSNQWVVGQEVDATTKAADLNCYSAQVPRQVANIYKIENSILLMGTASKDEVDASGRPNVLDRSAPYEAL